MFSALLSKTSRSQKRGSASGLSLLFCQPGCLCFRRYHTVLRTTALQDRLRSGTGDASSFVLLPQDFFVVTQGLEWLHMDFRIVLSLPKTHHWNLGDNYTESTDDSGDYGH